MNDVYLRTLISTECLWFCKNIKRIGKGLPQLKNNRALVRQVEVPQSSIDDGETAETRITLARENLERFFFYKLRDMAFAPVFGA